MGCRRQEWFTAVQVRPDGRAPLLFLLEDGLHDAFAHGFADYGRAFGPDIANLDATHRIDRDGLGICGVLRFGDQIDRLARLAHSDLEAPCRAGLVGMVGADDGEGEGEAAQLMRPLPRATFAKYKNDAHGQLRRF